MKLKICLFVKSYKLLNKFNEIWDKFREVIKKGGFDSEPVYINKCLKTKIIS